MTKTHYLDANCLVKLVIQEVGSLELRKHCWKKGIVCVTTSFCFYESLGVLKLKWKNKKRIDHISKEEYLSASEELCAIIEDGTIQLEEVEIHHRRAFNESEKLTKKYDIDLSDSFQLYTLKEGMIAQLESTIRPELITEDGGIYKAAIGENLVALKISDLTTN